MSTPLLQVLPWFLTLLILFTSHSRILLASCILLVFWSYSHKGSTSLQFSCILFTPLLEALLSFLTLRIFFAPFLAVSECIMTTTNTITITNTNAAVSPLVNPSPLGAQWKALSPEEYIQLPPTRPPRDDTPMNPPHTHTHSVTLYREASRPQRKHKHFPKPRNKWPVSQSGAAATQPSKSRSLERHFCSYLFNVNICSFDRFRYLMVIQFFL